MGPLSPPVGQQTRVQTFAAEQGAQATSRRRSGFGFLQDALLIFSGVGPPLRFGNHFGIRPRSRHRIGAHFGWRPTALRLPSPPLAPSPRTQTLRKPNTHKYPPPSFLFFSRPSLSLNVFTLF